ncbi:DUF427 domain-containing protein [Vannielia litorea]|uniref:Uncharacterized conserved protein, DUF427 family n=1 Tax=Vannielia litorea TaxID=1217970 RepID=A0A1N6ETA0_9RHOB|nr:DUF427 domain-containing protein [Vannielia litorea]SIN86153.1 Uncharacterized conserved protein, DUF427 family [Vannielia litorea]
MADHIKIREADGTWVVRAGGAVLGESSRALELTEGSMPFVIYFPREDIAMAFLDKSDTVTHCPHKGEAQHYDIEIKSGTIQNAAWSYEAPKTGVERIKDHMAFYAEKVTVEQI